MEITHLVSLMGYIDLLLIIDPSEIILICLFDAQLFLVLKFSLLVLINVGFFDESEIQ